MPRQATYHIAPNFNITPSTGEIALGNIIASLADPDRSLSRVDHAALSLRYPPVSTVRAGGRDLSTGKSRSLSSELWTDFALSSIGGGISGSLSTSFLDNLRVESFDTSSFTSDPAYNELELRLQAPRVERIAKPNRLGRHKPVYMVSAVVVARGVSIRQERKESREGRVGAQASVPTPVGDIGISTGVDGEKSQELMDEWSVYGDRVIAFRLLEIRVRGLRGKEVDLRTYREGAEMFSQGVQEDNEKSGDEGAWVEGNVEISEVITEQEEYANKRMIETEDGEVAIVRPEKTQ